MIDRVEPSGEQERDLEAERRAMEHRGRLYEIGVESARRPLTLGERLLRVELILFGYSPDPRLVGGA